MATSAVLVLLALFVAGSESEEMKYVLEEQNVLAKDPSRTTHAESRSLCAFECEIEFFCVAFAYTEHGGQCYLYDRDVNDGDYDASLNTNIYISNRRCGPLPTKQHASPALVQATYPAGSTVNYTCIAGMYPNGSHQTRCLPSGQWQLPIFTCESARSCQEIYNLGVTVPPTALIKPDPNQTVVTVSCDVTINGVYTIIGHGVANRTLVRGFEEKRSYVKTINYDINLQQIITIVDTSTECEQYIKFECFGSSIRDSGLHTRYGELTTYLIGGVKGQMDCACHLNNECVDGNRCNCDKNDLTAQIDEGYIRYKEDLPITAILIGDTGDTTAGEKLYYTVGYLKCKG